MKRAVLISLVFLLTSCNSAPSPVSPPQEIKNKAFEYMKRYVEIACGNGGVDCEVKEIKIRCSKRVDRSDAEKANGIKEKWCVDMSCIFRVKPKGNSEVEDWQDRSHSWILTDVNNAKFDREGCDCNK